MIMHPSARTAGFSIIELVVVIVLIGVLAAVALPRFIDTEDDARQAALATMRGTLIDAAALINAQARIEGLGEGSGSITVTGATIALHSGYPVSHWMQAVRYMVNQDTVVWTPAGTVCEATWCARGNQTSLAGAPPVTGRAAKIWPRGYAWGDRCGVYYINNENGEPPLVGILDADC